ncbi:hypothetical protein IHQ68_04830 [Chelatococcus sambhunathii]|uniref:Uncharacterized protein n=1 Tax=Chelatococcus sambhunathii TaxID=363953 RepID=A0ABU1DCX6_9HYPH|nr:hypothetical protein [Chelatococcus sambhunathii]MDR4305949.1 hypothetical protein [Chelatococcus sambhunathii]
MAEAAQSLQPQDSALDIATDQAIEACDGDAWATVRALLVANAALEEEIARLTARVSKGYARGRVRRAASE